MTRISDDVSRRRYKRALDRLFLRLIPTREAIKVKDNTLLVITVINHIPMAPNIHINRAALVTSDLVHFAFQVAYKRPDIILHILQIVLSDPVAFAFAMFCTLIK